MTNPSRASVLVDKVREGSLERRTIRMTCNIAPISLLRSRARVWVIGFYSRTECGEMRLTDDSRFWMVDPRTIPLRHRLCARGCFASSLCLYARRP